MLYVHVDAGRVLVQPGPGAVDRQRVVGFQRPLAQGGRAVGLIGLPGHDNGPENGYDESQVVQIHRDRLCSQGRPGRLSAGMGVAAPVTREVMSGADGGEEPWPLALT